METLTIIEFIVGKVLVIGLALFIMYGVYAFLIRATRRFQFMRFFLIGSLVFCFVLPFLKLSTKSGRLQSFAMADNLMRYFVLQEVVITPENPSFILDAVTINAETSNTIEWWRFIWVFYWTGVAIALIILIYRLLKIFLLFRKSEKRRIGKYVFVYTHQQHISFSFLNAIFLPEGEDHDSIVRHEQSHINHIHSIDTLLIEILIAFQWFNPIIYGFRKELKDIHEYTADHDVLESGVDKSEYMMLVLQQCTAVNISSIGNNFNVKLTKKRIKMMTSKIKSKRMLWRLLASLPVAVLLLLANAKVVGQEKNQATAMAHVQDGIPENDATEVLRHDDMEIIHEDDTIYKVVEQMPEFPGGTQKMMDFLVKNIKYPKEAQEKEVEGTVYVSFVVGTDGSVSNVEKIRGIGQGCDEEAVRVVKSMPKWKPGMQAGKPVKVSCTLPIYFHR